MEHVTQCVSHSLAYAYEQAGAGQKEPAQNHTGQNHTVQNHTGARTGTDAMEQYYTMLAEQYNRREGNLHEQDGYNCEKCKNKGFIAKAEYTEFCYWTKVDYECECRAVRDNIARMRKSGLQDVIAKYRFDTYETTEPWQQAVKQLAMDYAAAQIRGAEPCGWFFMGGASGAGKSHICTAICRELLLAGHDVQYMKWRDDSVKLKAMVNDAQYEREIQRLKTAKVLYVDDFFKCGQTEGGMQRPTAADVSLAFEILNDRYNRAGAITIISSESVLDDIFAIDEAIGGRIWERAGDCVIALSGKEKNYRRKGRGATL